MDRRALLLAAGGSIAVALAGCSGGDGDDQEGETPTRDDGSEAGNGDDGSPGDDGTDNGSAGDDGTDDGSTGETSIPGDPAATADAYVEAMDESNRAAAIALLHEDAVQSESDVGSDIEFFEGAAVTLEERGVIDSDEETVLVRGIVGVDQPDAGETNLIGLDLSLRQGPGGEWLIYDGQGQQLADRDE